VATVFSDQAHLASHFRVMCLTASSLHPNILPKKLMEVLESPGPEQSGKCCAWGGKGVES